MSRFGRPSLAFRRCVVLGACVGGAWCMCYVYLHIRAAPLSRNYFMVLQLSSPLSHELTLSKLNSGV